MSSSMLTSSTHGVKAALLRTYKEGGKRVAEQPNSSNDGGHYLLHYYSTLLPSTDPTRAITKLHTYLVEGDLRQLWQQGKQRLKRRLQDAHSVYKQPEAPAGSSSSSTVARATAAELEHLYGTNGIFRVSIRVLGWLADAGRSCMHACGYRHMVWRYMQCLMVQSNSRCMLW